MHEVSLMQNLLRVVGDAAREQGEGDVTEIHLRIGDMAGVNEDSLRFAFGILSKGTKTEGALLNIEKVPFRVHCPACSKEYEPQGMTLRCSGCGGASVDVISGREMEVDYIIVDDGR